MTARAERARERGPKAADAALWRLKHQAHDRLAAVAAPFNAVLATWDARLAAGQVPAEYHRHATAELRQQRTAAVATAKAALDAELADVLRHHDELAAQRAPTTGDELNVVLSVARALESTVLDADLKLELLREAVDRAATADQVNVLRELRPYLEGLSRRPEFSYASETPGAAERYERTRTLLATVAAETETEFTVAARALREQAGVLAYELGELADVITTHGALAGADDLRGRAVAADGQSIFRQLVVPGFEPEPTVAPEQTFAGMAALLGKSDAVLRAEAEAT